MSLDPSGIGPAFIRAKMSPINDRLFDGRIETCQCYQRMVCQGFDLGVICDSAEEHGFVFLRREMAMALRRRQYDIKYDIIPYVTKKRSRRGKS